MIAIVDKYFPGNYTRKITRFKHFRTVNEPIESK